MKKIKNFTILCSLLFMAVAAQAQFISGRLVDEQNQPLSYANVILLGSSDKCVVFIMHS